MRPIRIVHCADVHLDSSFIGAGLADQAAKLRAEELRETFARIIRLVRETAADLFLIAGDLFEEEYVRKSTVQSVIDLIRQEIPEVPVFIAPGNHDPFRADSYYATMAWPEQVTIFGPRWQRVELPHLGAVVHGWGFDRPHVTGRHLADLRMPPSEQVQLVVLHGSDEQVPSDEGVYLPLNRAECLAAGADYIALGHFHSHHVVAERPGGRGPLAQYPGAPESLSFGQSGPHGVVVGTVGREGNDLRLVPVGLREHVALAVDVTGAATVDEAVARVEAAIAGGGGGPPGGPRANGGHVSAVRNHLFRVTLTGEVDPDLDLDPAVLAARLAGRCHYIDVRNRTAPALDLGALAAEQSLRGRFVRRLLGELESAPAGEAEAIRQALRYGLRALEGGR